MAEDFDLTYNDYLQRVNIQDVLQDAGYQFYRRDGLKYPSYVRIGDDGRKVPGDKFIVNAGGWGCFQPPEMRVFNVISFIKEHPNLFQDYKPGMDKDVLVNSVCSRLLNTPMPNRAERTVIPNRNVKPFHMSDYDIRRYNPRPRYEFNQKVFDGWFAPRGINHETQKAFKDYFFIAGRVKLNEKEKKDRVALPANLAFPLTIPGKDGIVGLEERGKVRYDGTSFKGKAEGSNGAEGLWIANLTDQPLEQAENVLWFESAYDAMAQYQLSRSKDYAPKNVYVSTGGNPTVLQMQEMLAATRNARHYVGFDQDDAGKQFLRNFRIVAEKMGFPKDHVIANQPLGYYKDWNDALLGKKTMTLKDVTCDYDYKTMSYVHEGKEEKANASVTKEITLTDDERKDLKEYLASLREKNDILSGDTDLLPKSLGDLYGQFEADWEEWRSSGQSGLVHPDDLQKLREKAAASQVAYGEAMKAAVDDYMKHSTAEVKDEDKGKEGIAEYLASLREKNDILSGDTDLLPKSLHDLYEIMIDDYDEYCRYGSTADPDEAYRLKRQQENSGDVFMDALKAAIDDYKERIKEEGVDVAKDTPEQQQRHSFHR